MLFNSLFISYPNPEWLEDAKNKASHTPDIAWLEQSEHQLLFTCDNMMRKHSKYIFIAEHSAYVCTAFTMKDFNFWNKDLGKDSFQIAMEATGSPDVVRYLPPSAKIKGELHAVQSSRFIELDKSRDNGVQFLRKRVRLLVPYREVLPRENVDTSGQPLPPALLGKKGATSPEKIHIVKAWMYVGNPSYWNDLFDVGYSFSSVPLFEPHKDKKWLSRYYQYLK